MAKLIKLIPLLLALALLAGAPAAVSGQTPEATVEFDSAFYTVDEGAGTATVTVTVAGTAECAAAFPFSVLVRTVEDTATSPEDFVSFSSRVVSFAACQAEERIYIDLVNDRTVELDETFTVRLSRPASLDPAITLGTDESTVTIQDDDLSLISLSSLSYSVDEDVGTFSVTATASHPIDFPVDVQLSTSDGTAVAGEDYQSTSTTLSFPAGTTSVSTDIAIIDDDLVELDMEIFEVLLSTDEDNGAVRIRTLQSTVTITDDDSVTVSLSSDEYSVSEDFGTSTGTVEITVQVEGGPADCPVAFPFSVHLSTLDGTAGSLGFSRDFTRFSRATLSFDACEREQTIENTIFDDLTVERTETFGLKLERTATLDESIRLGRTEATVEIEDDDTAALSWTASTSSVGEGDGSITVSAGVASPDISCPVAFSFSVPLSIVRNTAENSDFSRRRDHVLQFDECDLLSAAQISIVDDRLVEHTETFNVRMERAPGLDDSIIWFTSEITVEITDDDQATVSFRNTDNWVREGDESVEVCVDVTQPGIAFPFFINIQADRQGDTANFGDDYQTSSSSSLEIRAHTLRQCVDYLILDDANVEDPESFTLRMQKPSGIDDSIVINLTKAESKIEILDDDVVTVGFLDRSPLTENVWAVTGGDPVELDIRLFSYDTCPAQFAFEVGLSHSDPGNALAAPLTIPSSLDFDACQQIYTFDVVTTSVVGTSEVDFTLERPSDLHRGIQLERDPTFKVKVFDSASSFLQFEEPEYIVGESDGTVTVTVSFSDPLDEALTLEFQVSNSTARTGSDYTQATSEVSVDAGVTSATHTINIHDDTKLEPSEQFIVSVTPGDGSDQFDGFGLLETSVVIQDDDTATVAFTEEEVVVNEGHWFQLELLVTVPEVDCGVDFPFAVSVPYLGPAGAIIDGPSSPSLVSFRGCETSRVIDFRAGDDAGGSGVEFRLQSTLFSDSRISAGEPSTVTVRILDTDPFARNPSQDFNNLGFSNPNGIWSDGRTMWVASPSDDTFYAYYLTTKARDADKDFDNLAANNGDPQAIWSDGETMWAGEGIYSGTDGSFGWMFAYKMDINSDGSVGSEHGVRESAKEFDPNRGSSPRGIWSKGDTMWITQSVAGTSGDIRAYQIDISSGGSAGPNHAAAQTSEDFPGVVGEGLWSDGTTIWVAHRRQISAYDLATKNRLPDMDFNELEADAQGIWSDGETMWVVGGDKIYAYYMPPNALRPPVRPRPIQTTVVDADPEPPQPEAVKVEECVSDVEDEEVGGIEVGDTISGKWEADCPSITRGGRLAKYYTLSLPITTAVAIALDSHLDDYLVLRRGGLSGNVVAEDDDSGPGNNSLIEETLTAGEYTVESTTFYADDVEAQFTLSVTVAPRILHSGPVSEVSLADYTPDGPILTVRMLPTMPTGTLEITIEDDDGFGAGAGPLGGAQTSESSSGMVVIALPKTAVVDYDGIAIEVRESGGWFQHTLGDEQGLLALGRRDRAGRRL